MMSETRAANPGWNVASLFLLIVIAGCDRPSDEQANAYGYCVGGAGSARSELFQRDNLDEASKLEKLVNEVMDDESVMSYMQSGVVKHWWNGLYSAQADYLVAKTKNDLRPFLVRLRQECESAGVEVDLSGFGSEAPAG